MKPQRQLDGTPRKIVGFHLDEYLDWVAELECGHQQHVRHNPPFTGRHWVTTTEGRRSHLGSQLICVACSAPLSDSAVLTVPNRNAPVWDQTGSAMSGKASAREIEKTEEIGMTQEKQNTNSLISLRELIKEVFQPLPPSLLEKLVQEILPEVRRIASSSHRAER